MSREHIHMPQNVGDRVADAVATGMGSWTYIIIQTVIVALWIALNSMGWFVWKWDPMPFILLNLIFSTQASYAAPIIMKSQNRQAEKDRARDDIESVEVSEIHAMLQLLKAINEQQLAILTLLKETRQS